MNQKTKKAIRILKKGGIGVMPTDTIYGLVGSAFSRRAILRIYKIRKRNSKKKLIILISAIAEIEKFGVKINREQIKVLKKFWPHYVKATWGRPEPVSIVVNGIAFRLPAKKSLLEILKKTGPLVAPSANPEGLPPARNIREAKKYFGGGVDFYLAGGTLKGQPSALLAIDKNGGIKILRGQIPKSLEKA
jgi:L-threonylcarbamoyladenylate synthase